MADHRLCSVFWIYFTAFWVLHQASGLVPVSEVTYEWAEPDASARVFDPAESQFTREHSLQRLDALRAVMADQIPPVDAYVIPTADAHNSQYIAPTDARREWISGLSGSSGTAVVTQDEALLWTDGRYFTQFYLQVNTTLWTLMRQGTDASIQSWLTENLAAGAVVGIDPTTFTRNAWTPLENALQEVGISLQAVPENLVDQARHAVDDAPPERPNDALIPLSLQYTGKPAGEKISELTNQILTRGVAALVLTALDDIAYTLNLRGSDIPYNPVFFSYLIIRPQSDVTLSNVTLFWGDGVLSSEVLDQLSEEGVILDALPYDEVLTALSSMANDLDPGSVIWLSQDGSEAVHRAAAADGAVSTLSTLSPVALLKCIKNEVELQGFRDSHIKDGTAVVRFLHWIHQQVDEGVTVTEIDASKKLIEFRSDEKDFMGPSFATIAGAGENGAIIHYKPSEDGEQREIRPEDMFLVDSGGQYRDGTTDITRTRHMSSNPTPLQRLAFTRVLKGQTLLATAVFPKRSAGNILDILARKALWDVGLNYAHGTGHGVGHFLNVHEGPSGIGSGLSSTDPGIQTGMIFSNEPGFYEVGEFGIRHEDLVEVIELTNDSDHIFAAGLVDNFGGQGALGFHTISLAPHQAACIDVTLLNEHEIKYINDYHARVLATLGPILQERGHNDVYNWLERECAPLGNSAFLLMATPLLVMLTSLTLWF